MTRGNTYGSWIHLSQKLKPNKNMGEFLSKIRCEDDKNYICNLLILGNLLDGVKGKKILDVGCGESGEYALLQPYLCRSLFKKGADVEGIDVSVFQEKEDFKVYNTFAHEALETFTENTYDAVIASRLFSDGEFRKEFYHTTRPIISNIHRVLKKGGFYINLCNPQTLNASYKQFCEEAGFNLIEMFTKKDNKYREWHIWRK